MPLPVTPVATEVRTIALSAIARGWLDAANLFDIGFRAGLLAPEATLHEAFGSSLSREQLDALGASPPDAPATLAEPRDALQLRAVDAEDADRAAQLAANASAQPATTRYVPGALLGEGGMGRVIAALDRHTGRTIALKTLRSGFGGEGFDPQRFVAEARVTAQLEHPAIIPVYDLGALPDGRLYYTMRIVRQRSLAEVLASPTARTQWPLARLCGVFVQVCRALAYAHARGVIHRDLKPENILLGEYGEVYVADWGVAKIAGQAEITPTIQTGTAPTAVGTAVGSVIGTLGYMAPEQVLGEIDIDSRADVFALGVILYEVLTGKKPFEAATQPALMLATITQTPSPPRTHQPACPVLLEELCLRMLAKDRAQRPATTEDVAAEMDAFLEGAKEKARRHAEAERLAAEASAHAQRHLELRREQDDWTTRARDALRDVKGWEPLDRKRPAWALEDRAREVQRDDVRALAAAVERYVQALGYEQDNPVVRNGLAALYWARAQRCEIERDDVGQMYNETLVRDYDDGTYEARLTADALVSVDTNVPGAKVVAFRYVERDRVLCMDTGLALGVTPVREARLAPGSWVLTLRRAGFRDARYPLVAHRGERRHAQVNLYADEVIGEGLIYVPGGSCILGGDAESFDGLARQNVDVPDFAIGQYPITFDEYLVFIEDLERRDPEAAHRRLPYASDTKEGLFVERNADGRWAPRWEAIVDGEAGKQFCPREQVGRVPVCCINWFDAVAYCKWRSERDGRAYRLPTEFEREKAARGVDGRWFPWGDRFDPTFCKMRESRPGASQPEPVGAFTIDESPYGVRDLAGGMRDWVADIVGDLSVEAALAEPEPPAGAPRDHGTMRSSRGGSWFALTSWCRAASRLRYAALYRSAYRGLRLAHRLGPDAR